MHKRSNIDEVASTIVSIDSYVDSVAVWLPRPLVPYEIDTLEGLCGCLNVPVQPQSMAYHPVWVQRIIIHQPSDQALHFLHEITQGKHLINHVAIALDWTTECIIHAERLQQFIVGHMVLPWRPNNQRTGEYKSTSYISDLRWVNRNICTYSDKQSKITQQPCCHLEYRLCKSQTLKRAGITSVLDICEMDLSVFWEKRLKLKEINYEKIGKIVNNRTNRRAAWEVKRLPNHDRSPIYNKFIFDGCRFCACVTGLPYPSHKVQDVLDGSPIDIRNCLINIEAEKLLIGLDNNSMNAASHTDI